MQYQKGGPFSMYIAFNSAATACSAIFTFKWSKPNEPTEAKNIEKKFLDLKFNPSTLSKIQQIYLVSDLHIYENKHEK